MTGDSDNFVSHFPMPYPSSIKQLFLWFAPAICSLLLLGGTAVFAEGNFIVLASTTSTENSGLLTHLKNSFEKESGIEVRVVAVGTGQAIKIAADGNADVLMVHHQRSEEVFVAEGFGVERVEFMYNDFVIVGPKSDPAELGKTLKTVDALKSIHRHRPLFISRSDNSGTHKRELDLWEAASLEPETFNNSWYREIGSGMGATLNMASATLAYTLADRGTWLAFENRTDLALLFEGDPPLHNQYSVILVNPEKHAHIKSELGQRFVDWLISEQGQTTINDFRLNDQQLFFANAKK